MELCAAPWAPTGRLRLGSLHNLVNAVRPAGSPVKDEEAGLDRLPGVATTTESLWRLEIRGLSRSVPRDENPRPS